MRDEDAAGKEVKLPYQEKGVTWLKAKTRALLGDDMGLGKTPQTIWAADELALKTILVVCPAAVRFNWVLEFQKFSKYQAEIVPSRPSAFGFPDVAVVSWDWAARYGGTELPPRDLLILDEAHFAKNPNALRTKGVFSKAWQDRDEDGNKIGPVLSGLAHKARRIWALSGTPAPNHPGELWPLLCTFGATPLGYAAFTDTYCSKRVLDDGTSVMSVRKNMVPVLRKMLSGIMLRRLKKDVLLDLPPVDVQTMAVQADPEDQAALAAVIEKCGGAINTLQELIRRDPASAAHHIAHAIEHLGSLRRVVGIAKAKPACEIIHDALDNRAFNKVIVFCIHKDVVTIVRKALAKFGVVAVVGDTPPTLRKEAVEKFQKDPGTRVFIGNIIAAGTGLTLTAAQDVFMLEQDWVPGNNRQAIDRAHRIGQVGSVTARFVHLVNSVDEQVARVLARKAKDFEAVFN